MDNIKENQAEVKMKNQQIKDKDKLIKEQDKIINRLAKQEESDKLKANQLTAKITELSHKAKLSDEEYKHKIENNSDRK